MDITKTVNRPIPGTIVSHDREFLYVEIRCEEEFAPLIDKVFEGAPSIPSPQNGGVIEERIQVTLKDDRTLLGIS